MEFMHRHQLTGDGRRQRTCRTSRSCRSVIGARCLVLGARCFHDCWNGGCWWRRNCRVHFCPLLLLLLVDCRFAFCGLSSRQDRHVPPCPSSCVHCPASVACCLRLAALRCRDCGPIIHLSSCQDTVRQSARYPVADIKNAI